MTLDRRLLLFAILVMGFVIIHLNIKLNRLYRTAGYVTSVKYTPTEIIQRIKQSKNYKGDSIFVDEDGKLGSHNIYMQGNLREMYNIEINANNVFARMKEANQPVQYYFYELASFYFTPADSATNP